MVQASCKHEPQDQQLLNEQADAFARESGGETPDTPAISVTYRVGEAVKRNAQMESRRDAALFRNGGNAKTR